MATNKQKKKKSIGLKPNIAKAGVKFGATFGKGGCKKKCGGGKLK